MENTIEKTDTTAPAVPTVVDPFADSLFWKTLEPAFVFFDRHVYLLYAILIAWIAAFAAIWFM